MTPNAMTTLDKTIAFLRKKTNMISKRAALEMMGKSEEEMRIIWDRITMDFCNMGMKYFVREYNKNLQKSQEV